MSERRIAALVAVLLLACSPTGADDDTTPDSGTAAECDMQVSFSPAMPEAPSEILVDGTIDRVGWVSGVEDFQFSVTFAGVAVPVEERDPFDGSKIKFVAAAPGPYHVALTGSVGALDCIDASEVINVIDPGAETVSYRLRFVPASSQPAPIQEQLVAIPGGAAAFNLGTLSLANGVAINGSVEDAATAPLPSYLRMTGLGAASQVVETFADSGGSFTARLAAGTYDVMVVPASEVVAPMLLASLGVADLALLALTNGDAISGTVRDGSGGPLAGARVSLRIDGVPSTIATSGASGEFTVLARAGGATSVTVSPPPSSGLPRLELGADAGLVASASAPLTIAYAPALPSRAVDLQLLTSLGASAADARVTWIMRTMAAAGSVTAQGDSARVATGELRLTSVADGDGAVAIAAIPAAIFDAIIEPATASSPSAVRLTSVDLSAGMEPPATLSLAEPAALTGVVVDASSQPIAGVVVTATPRGMLANVAGAAAMATTSATGGFSLAVVGAGEYDLVFQPADANHARVRAEVVAPAAGAGQEIAAVELPQAIAVTGEVSIPGVAGGASGVHLMVLCSDCAGVAAKTPIAEAVTSSTGRFELAIPNPGVAAARR